MLYNIFFFLEVGTGELSTTEIKNDRLELTIGFNMRKMIIWK